MTTGHPLPDADPRLGRPVCGGRKRTLVATVLSFVSLLASTVGAQEAPAWAGMAKTAPAGLLDVALTKRDALFTTQQQVDGKWLPYIGFFIGGDGLALCSVTPLSWKTGPMFMADDEEKPQLPQPAVLAVFPDQELALVKFAFKPKKWLTLAKEQTPVGSWVAVLSPSFVPNPVLAPILARRQISMVAELVPRRAPVEKFSFGAGRNPSIEKVFVQGAPLVDARGEVVATFSGSQPLPGQTLRIASPLAGLQEQIQEAVKKGERLKLPLSATDLQMDPAALSEEKNGMGIALMQRDFPKGMKLAKSLVARFPDSLFARTEEFACALTGSDLGEVSGEELVDLAKKFKLQESDPPWEKSAYHCRLGEALLRANRLDEAIASLKKSDELWPQNMACMSLAGIFERRNQMDEAERYWRRATSLDQERIEYWECLSRVLSALLKTKEEREASDRVNFLEDLYRSR